MDSLFNYVLLQAFGYLDIFEYISAISFSQLHVLIVKNILIIYDIKWYTFLWYTCFDKTDIRYDIFNFYIKVFVIYEISRCSEENISFSLLFLLLIYYFLSANLVEILFSLTKSVGQYIFSFNACNIYSIVWTNIWIHYYSYLELIINKINAWLEFSSRILIIWKLLTINESFGRIIVISCLLLIC